MKENINYSLKKPAAKKVVGTKTGVKPVTSPRQKATSMVLDSYGSDLISYSNLNRVRSDDFRADLVKKVKEKVDAMTMSIEDVIDIAVKESIDEIDVMVSQIFTHDLSIDMNDFVVGT